MRFGRGIGLGKFGVIYVALGAPYLSMALVSMVSLRVTNPDVPVCIVTNVTDKAPEVPWWQPEDHWKFIDLPDQENRAAKLMMYELSPYDETLFLDCDTIVLASIAPLRGYLEFFDVLMRYGYEPKKRRPPLLGRFRYSEDGHFNSGVIAFRRSQVVAEFFSTWQERFTRLGSRYDQPSLVEAWFLSSAKVFPLPQFWNTNDRWYFAKKIRNRIVIWHYRTRIEDSLEEALAKAPTWYGANKGLSRDNSVFLDKRRKQRRHGSIAWKLRTLITKLRGGLFRRLESHPNAEQWRTWINYTPSP